MTIDWFTFFAQIVNFLILVWLLKRFLYRPVLAAMARREEGIAQRLAEAQARAEESEEEKKRYLTMQNELAAGMAQEMQRAKEEADSFRQDLLATATTEVEAKRESWLNALKKEELSFLSETSHAISAYFQDLSRNALGQLAQEDLEKRIISVFFDTLVNHDRQAIAELSSHVAASNEALLVTTAFTLTAEQQADIISRLESVLAPAHGYEFAVDRSLLAGITVEVAGKKIHWDLSEYLKNFEKRLASFLASHPTVGREH